MNYHNLNKINNLSRSHLQQIVRSSLEEDTGRQDITTELTVSEDKLTQAVLVAKEKGIICGLDIARLVFKTQDKNIKFKAKVLDGDSVKKGKILVKISGKARSILTAERVALNFLTFLSSIATKTKKYVDVVRPYKVRIMDTRKTIPGLRALEKYAVRVGGGFNHRFRLDEMMLIKDNHLKVIGGYRRLPKITENYRIELEVKNLKEFKEALRSSPDIIMLDNMVVKDIKKAVKIRNNLSPKTYHPKPKLEASGNITLKNIRQVARSGVDMISLGTLTHSIEAVDISLEIL